MPIISDQPAVIELAKSIQQGDPSLSAEDAADQALQEFYGLAEGDGIWGTSNAAVCMGFIRGEDDNMRPLIVQWVAQQLAMQ